MPNTNTVTNVIAQLLAQGLLALRQNSIMPRYVNRTLETIAAEKGSSVDVPIPSAITAVPVTPSYVAPDDAGISPTKTNITLDQWYRAPFFLTDKEMLEVQSGTIPMQATEAIKALANNVDSAILNLYKQVYGYAGTAGTTPFATGLDEFLEADQVLADQLAPMDPRFVILNARATANAKGLRAIQDASWRNDPTSMQRNNIGSILGYSWDMDQNVPRHTAGTAAAFVVNQGTTPTGYFEGDTVIAVDGGTGDFVEGDIVVFASHDQTYVVRSVTGASPTTAITIQPPLVADIADNEVITSKASHRVNIAAHRDAFALVSRPFSGADPLGLGFYQSIPDPVSGLALRLEITRQSYRTLFQYDILYGVKCIRPELACRIAGE